MTMDSPHSPAPKKDIGSIIGFVVFYGLLWVIIMISAEEGMPQLREISWRGALEFGLLLFLFLFVAYFLLRSPFFQQFRFRSFRASMVYGTCLALLFSIWPLSANSDNIRLFLIFFFSGLIVGVFYGRTAMRVMEKKIVNDRIVVPGIFPESMQFKDYWVQYLMLYVVWGASLALSREVFHSKDAYMGTLAGLFLGMCLYCLLWAYIYEKQNNLRLTFAYSGHDPTSVEAHT